MCITCVQAAQQTSKRKKKPEKPELSTVWSILSPEERGLLEAKRGLTQTCNILCYPLGM